MKNGKLQAKDISDAEMMDALARTRGMNGVPEWSARSDVEGALPSFPPKVVLAKLASLVRRGVIDGCTCGCRGDFELPGARVR